MQGFSFTPFKCPQLESPTCSHYLFIHREQTAWETLIQTDESQGCGVSKLVLQVTSGPVSVTVNTRPEPTHRQTSSWGDPVPGLEVWDRRLELRYTSDARTTSCNTIHNSEILYTMYTCKCNVASKSFKKHNSIFLILYNQPKKLSTKI